MNDKEKLQRLFDAALKAPPVSPVAILRRRVPESVLDALPAAFRVEDSVHQPRAREWEGSPGYRGGRVQPLA